MTPVPLHILVVGLLLATGAGRDTALDCRRQEGTLCGVVRDDVGPVAGATVRLQGASPTAVCDENGRFVLDLPEVGETASLTATAPGYYIGGGREVAVRESIEITLEHHPATDDPTYEWIGAATVSGEQGHCAECHARASEESPPLPFDAWLDGDAHARSVENPRFLSMYSGSDVRGNQSPPTRWVSKRDYGRFPLPPDPARSYYGPGYRLDYPDSPGNCGACHAPVAAVERAYEVDMIRLDGVAREGVTCDFCHKVIGVRLDPETGRPAENMPGVLSFVFRRPGSGHQFFAGPLDDVAPGEDVYSPLYRESRYCAPCHFGVFWGTVIYDSFGEWLESRYSDPSFRGARTCQDCHLPRAETDHFANLERGGRKRDPATFASHRLLGIEDEELLRAAASLDLTVERRGELVAIAARVENDRTGHHLPTGSPLRQVVLVVEAHGSDGTPLPFLDGPRLPSWAGDLAGSPGRVFAKVLQEIWTESSPSAAYWNPTRVLADSRLPALGADTSFYTVAAPLGADVVVTGRLLYRRAFSDLARRKGWEIPDRVMATAVRSLHAPSAAIAIGNPP